jgi:hypothetical protein
MDNMCLTADDSVARGSHEPGDMRGNAENLDVASLIWASTVQNVQVPARIRPSFSASASTKVGTDSDTVV